MPAPTDIPVNRPTNAPTDFDLAVVIPALNEAGNLRPLVEQIDRAFASTPIRYQIVVVDDGSRDATAAELKPLAETRRDVCVASHDKPRGQSAALRTGMQASSAPLIATLDADLQNDPADLPRMLDLLESHHADLVQGDRTANRRDHTARRIASAVGRWARRLIVGDRVRDTGCATRVMRRAFALRLPLDRPGMHRFIPACVAGFGGEVIETPVNHRPRHTGKTKYGTGLIKRGLPGLRDCFRVRRLIRAAQAAHVPPSATTTPPAEAHLHPARAHS